MTGVQTCALPIYIDFRITNSVGNYTQRRFEFVALPDPVVIPGDANTDGLVDIADLGIVGINFNLTGAEFSDGDFNSDLIVDIEDLGILGANWSMAQEPSLVPRSEERRVGTECRSRWSP